LRENLGITVVVVTHELSSIRAIADNIVFLQKGKVLFDGSLAQAVALESGPVFDFFNRRELRDEAVKRGALEFAVESVA
jgi:phospholipid/cholesterol/gamma-HCH transport system ATP-binding protein